MQIAQILNQANACTTDVQVTDLSTEIGDLIGAMSEMRPVAGPRNMDSYLERTGQPHLRFDFQRFISHDFSTEIRPEVRDGKFTVLVTTYQMMDRLGDQSQNVKVFLDLEELLEPAGDADLREVICDAKAKAIEHHAKLIECVGVPKHLAIVTAENSWVH